MAITSIKGSQAYVSVVTYWQYALHWSGVNCHAVVRQLTKDEYKDGNTDFVHRCEVLLSDAPTFEEVHDAIERDIKQYINKVNAGKYYYLTQIVQVANRD